MRLCGLDSRAPKEGGSLRSNLAGRVLRSTHVAVHWQKRPARTAGFELRRFVSNHLQTLGRRERPCSPTFPPQRLFACSGQELDRKSTRLNSSHVAISYAV